MLMWILAVSVLLPGQTADAFFGAIPKDVPTFQIIEKGERKGYGALQLDGVWVHDLAALTPAKRPLIVYDTPWAPATEVARYGRFVYEPSAEALRMDRLKAGWRRAGYVFVDTPQGEIPVLETDLALAERARAMAQAQQLESNDGATAGVNPSADEGVAQPGFLTLWGGHLAVVAIALLLLIVVAKTMIFSDADDWEKVG